MNSHDGDKKTNNNQTASASTFEKIMSGQNDISVKIFSYLDLKSIWRLSNVNRLIKQKFLSMSKLNEQGQRIPYKYISDYEFSCDFINFVYGKGNTERLPKIVDEAVEYDANVYENKTNDELHVLIPVTGKQNYNSKKSIFHRINNVGSLVKEMLWHMVLLDILNIKLVDFERKKSLSKEISDIVKRNSKNRLNFLFRDVKEYDNFRYGGFAAALYDYAKLIFKLPDKRKELSTEKEELIKKIFACFIKVSFLRMEQAERFEPYKNDSQQYSIYRDAILHLKRCFYMCHKPYKSLCDENDWDDYYNFGTYIHSDALDMATYLFLTDELEELFNNNEGFVYDFGFDYYHATDYEYSHFGAFLFFLNKIQPLEKRYTGDKDKFIKMFVAVENAKWGYWDLIEYVQGVLTFFESKELRQNLIDDVIKKFKSIFGRESERAKWNLYYGYNMCKRDDIFEEKGSLSKQINRTTFQDEKTKKYFECLIKRFTGNNDYNKEAIKIVSNKIFGDGKVIGRDRLSYLNKIEPIEKRYKSNKKKFIAMFFPAEKYRYLKLDETSLLSDENIRAILTYFKDKKTRSELIKNLNYEMKLNCFARACKQIKQIIQYCCCGRKTEKKNKQINLMAKFSNSIDYVLSDMDESERISINPNSLNNYKSIFSNLGNKDGTQNENAVDVPKIHDNQNKNKYEK